MMLFLEIDYDHIIKYNSKDSPPSFNRTVTQKAKDKLEDKCDDLNIP